MSSNSLLRTTLTFNKSISWNSTSTADFFFQWIFLSDLNSALGVKDFWVEGQLVSLQHLTLVRRKKESMWFFLPRTLKWRQIGNLECFSKKKKSTYFTFHQSLLSKGMLFFPRLCFTSCFDILRHVNSRAVLEKRGIQNKDASQRHCAFFF